jgi:hypothetical protein
LLVYDETPTEILRSVLADADVEALAIASDGTVYTSLTTLNGQTIQRNTDCPAQLGQAAAAPATAGALVVALAREAVGRAAASSSASMRITSTSRSRTATRRT